MIPAELILKRLLYHPSRCQWIWRIPGNQTQDVQILIDHMTDLLVWECI